MGLYTTMVIDARLVGIWRRMKMAAQDDAEYREKVAKVRRRELPELKVWEDLLVDQ